MLKSTFRLAPVILGVVLVAPAPARADDYVIDPVHSSVTFMVSHAGISYVHGRFNELSGNVTIDKEDPAKSSFALTIKVESVDSNNKKRDEHLRSPDFFNAKQFPTLTFQSTSVKPVDGGYEVTGDLTLHGVKKSVTLQVKGGKTVEFPKGMPRIGFTVGSVIKRSEYGMDKMLEAIGDEVHVALGLEAVQKK